MIAVPMRPHLHDPLFVPDSRAHAQLSEAVRQDILKQPRALSERERRALSDRIAMAATLTLLRPLAEAGLAAVDANIARPNNPGFDVLVDGRLRLQVKGCSWVELIAVPLPVDTRDVGYESDLFIIVDIGCTIDTAIGRLAKYAIPRQPHVAFYIIPTLVLRAFMSTPTPIRNRFGAWLTWYKRPVKRGCREDTGQFRDLPRFRGRFDLIEAALASAPPLAPGSKSPPA